MGPNTFERAEMLAGMGPLGDPSVSVTAIYYLMWEILT